MEPPRLEPAPGDCAAWPQVLGPQIPFDALRIKSRVRSGSFGVVYRARMDGRPVVLKVLIADGRLPLQLFVQEASILKRVNQRSIVKLLGLTTVPAGARGITEASSSSKLAIVEEFFERGTMQSLILRQMVSSISLYSMSTALDMAIDIAEALEYLHGLTPIVLHRDITPDNILLTKENKKLRAKLCDFGLVALVGELGETLQRLNSEHLSMNVSQSGQLAGPSSSQIASSYPNIFCIGDNDTAPYGDQDLTKVDYQYAPIMSNLTGETGTYCHMAPENFLSQPYGETADTFSLGMVLYELFSKNLVFMSEMDPESPYAPKEFAYRLSKGYRPTISNTMCPEIAALIGRCWEPDPLLRPRMREVVEELKEIRASGALDRKRGFFSQCWKCSCGLRRTKYDSEALLQTDCSC